jgi:parallel beta helix pectate lyase-like protein
MKKTRFSLNTLATLTILLCASSLAHAQATRTWVSGVGDDANPCSRTAPCKTFAGAISKTAAAGEIDALDPGGFGAVTITKSITIDGGLFNAGILAALVNGVIVNTPNATDVVTLRNLAIQGAGNGLNGIRFIQNGKLHVDQCRITGFRGSPGRGIDFAPTAANTVLTVTNTNITDNAAAGIALVPAAAGSVIASIDNCLFQSNQNGLSASDKSTVSIRNTRASHNSSNGFLAVASANGSPEIFLETCVSSGNSSNGLRTQGPGTPRIRISNVTIAHNATGISVGTGEIKSFGNNHNAGNTVADGAPTAPNLANQ